MSFNQIFSQDANESQTLKRAEEKGKNITEEDLDRCPLSQKLNDLFDILHVFTVVKESGRYERPASYLYACFLVINLIQIKRNDFPRRP